MDLRKYLKKYYPKKRIRYPHNITMITDYNYDVIPDSVFIARKGYQCDGYNFINDAIKRGAKTIIYNSSKSIEKAKGINYIDVKSPLVEQARLTKMTIENQSHKPIFIGVSGSSGKTSVTFLIYSFLKNKQYDVLLVGTHHLYSYYGTKEEVTQTENTTPNLSILLKELYNKDYNYDFIVMEVSSQGICEHRILGLEFDIIAITNLCEEHLDYHHTFTEYRMVKGTFLKYLKQDSPYKSIILNIDDDNFEYFNTLTLEKIISIGIKSGTIQAYDIELSSTQTKFKIKDEGKNYQVLSSLIGEFNVYNILIYYAVLKQLNFKKEEIIDYLKNNITIPGRMNTFYINKRSFIVDYAHTINAVESVLSFFINRNDYHNLITVIGAGGDRDKAKRPIFGKLATKYSDYVIFTTDNPRTEKPQIIIEDMICEVETSNFTIVINRAEAIRLAYKISEENDIILILGKGNEKSITIDNKKIPYCDLDVVREIINE